MFLSSAQMSTVHLRQLGIFQIHELEIEIRTLWFNRHVFEEFADHQQLASLIW